MHNGWTRPDPVTATKEVIGPLTVGLAAMILIPGLAFRATRHFVPFIPMDDKFLCESIDPHI